MDQKEVAEALTPSTSLSNKKLNAKAPEFVPRSSTAPPQPKSVQPVYVRPPPFLPPTYYYQQDAMPVYGYNVNPLNPVELGADPNSCGASLAANSTKNGLSDAHLKILNQVEFYFSDINLATTDQLFRLMCKDPDGYVPLSVVASFKKIKSAISDSMQLAIILQSSKKLLVSEDGKKVKLQHPLSESDMEELQSRIVVAENLPDDHSHQNLMKIFSSIGSVRSIRTCPPQHSNSGAPSASKTGRMDAVNFTGKLHAYVEYESVELAEKAVVELTDEGNWRNGLKVRLLLKSAVHTFVKPTQVRGKKVGYEGHVIGRKDETTTSEAQCFKENHLEDSLPQSDYQIHEDQPEDNGSSNRQRKGRNYAGGSTGSGKTKGRGKGRGRPQHHPINGGSPPNEVSVSTIDKLAVMSKTHPVPRMPDGTKGFSAGRGKPVDVKIA